VVVVNSNGEKLKAAASIETRVLLKNPTHADRFERAKAVYRCPLVGVDGKVRTVGHSEFPVEDTVICGLLLDLRLSISRKG